MAAPSIILTGHRGFIGSALLETLAQAKIGPVIALSADLRNPHQIQQELAPLTGDDVRIIHLATINRRACSRFEDYAANGEMLANLLRATERFTARKLLFASSTDVYGQPASLPLSEASLLKPQDWYALSKSTGEWMLRHEGVDAAIFRLPGVYGARPNERSLPRFLLQQGLREGRVQLNNGGRSLRDLVWVQDVLALMLNWVRAPQTGLWNVASGQSCSIHDLVFRLRELWGASFEIVTEEKRTGRDYDLSFNPDRLRQSYPDVVVRPAMEMLTRYVDELRAIAQLEPTFTTIA